MTNTPIDGITYLVLNTEQGEGLVLIHDRVLEFLETKYLENMSNCPGDHSDITDLESYMYRLEYTEIKLLSSF